MDRLLIGLFIGMLIGGPAAFYVVEKLEGEIERVALVVLVVTLLVGLLLLIIAATSQRLIESLFGKVRANVDGFAEEGIAALDAYRRGDAEEAFTRGSKAAREAAAWYSRNRLRHWIVRTAVAALLAFGATLGSVLLYRQNLLLQAQNDKIDVQNELAEAQRRAALIPELTSILQQIAQEKGEWDRMDPEKRDATWRSVLGLRPEEELRECGHYESYRCRQGEYVLSNLTVGRIAALTKVLRPYKFVEPEKTTAKTVIKTTERELSPERAQILITLLSSGVYLYPVLRQADFSYADLRGVEFSQINLTPLKATGADFRGAKFDNIVLDEFCFLDFADFRGATFNWGKIGHITFKHSRFADATFNGVYLCNTSSFENADLVGIKEFEVKPCSDQQDRTALDELRRSVPIHR